MSGSPEKVLVVEDERAQREVLVQCLLKAGYAVEASSSGEDAVSRIATFAPSVLLTDLCLPDLDGLAVIRRAREWDEDVGVLLVTAYASVESAVEALRLGAHDYLLKPLILEEVTRKVASLVTHRSLVRENARLRRLLQERTVETGLVAESPAMKDVLAWVRRAATARATVLVTGETGTGKELVARAIHAASPSRDEPFLAVSVSAIPEPLIESELFGHEKGAFTGAERRREGILRSAGKGTVFLDEVGELSPSSQAKLLRALESREVQPLGSDWTAAFEARVLAATHRNLPALVDEGRFREDLFYRLAVLRIEIPPLRERPEDVPGLVRHLVRRHAVRAGVPAPSVTPEAMKALCRHPWRGNVRELSNVLERALILAESGRIEVSDLPGDVLHTVGLHLDLEEAIDRFERSYVTMALRLCGGSREKAAEELGISPATLYRRLERFGLKGQERSRPGQR